MSSLLLRLARGLACAAALAAPAVQATAAAPAAAAAEPSPRLERVRQAGVVRVCIWPDYYGISYRHPVTRQLSGIDVDLAQELGKELGVSVQFVDSSFARLFDDVLGERCDVAMFAIGVTPARQERLRFTVPHLASDIYAITTRSNRRVRSWEDIDRPGVVVAVARGTLHEPVMRERLRQARLVALDTPHAREQEVESGRADVFMTDFPYSRRMLANTDWARLVAPSSTYHVTPYAWAVAPGDEGWLRQLDAFVARIKRDGRLATAARRHGLDPIVIER